MADFQRKVWRDFEICLTALHEKSFPSPGEGREFQWSGACAPGSVLGFKCELCHLLVEQLGVNYLTSRVSDSLFIKRDAESTCL